MNEGAGGLTVVRWDGRGMHPVHPADQLGPGPENYGTNWYMALTWDAGVRLLSHLSVVARHFLRQYPDGLSDG